MLKEFKIYCDLDGVIADFDGRVKEITGKWPKEFPSSNQVWKALDLQAEDNYAYFYSGVNLLPDAHILWEFLKPFNPEILTALGRLSFSTKVKLDWIYDQLDSEVKVLFVERGEHKAIQYGKKGTVLIDDKEKSIISWRKTDGIGVVHKSAEETIRNLKLEIMLYTGNI